MVKTAKAKSDKKALREATKGNKSLSALSKTIKKTATSHKGRKILESREPKNLENPKTSVFIRGKKGSQTCVSLMRDLHMLRYFDQDRTKLYLRKTLDLLPFEAPGNLETFAEKHDASLQVTCTHQKKRPDNLIFSRTFGFKVLDMFEFGVSDYRSLSANASNTDTDHFLRPNLVFQGEHWNLSDKMMRLRNYFIDFFGPSKYS